MNSSVDPRIVGTLALLLLACVSCGAVARPVTKYPAPIQLNDAELHVGAVAVDITPPPGLTLFGSGSSARTSRGWRGRLECQAIVVTQEMQPIALVTCDLSAIAAHLHQRVAELVAQQGIPLKRGQILLMATATEAAPANYFVHRCFSGSVSTNPSGFDAEVLNWIAERIASAVVRAFAAREPAELRWGVASVSRLTRNRATRVLLANAPNIPVALSQLPVSEAVDGTLTVLRFDRTSRLAPVAALKPIAVFSVFGMHQNGVNVDNDVYQSDVFGFARRELERKLAENHGQGRPTVVALANGIDADTETSVMQQTVRESERIGEMLASEIGTVVDKLQSTAIASQAIAIAYRELNFPGAVVRAETDSPRLRTLPEKRERLSIGQLRFEQPKPKRVETDYAFPKKLAVSVLRFGGILVATVPARVSSVSGLRIREAVRVGLGQETANVAIVSSTNGCMQDVSTAEEFPLLDARIASVYGPHTGEFFSVHLACLARALDLNVRSSKEFEATCGLGQPAIGGVTSESQATETFVERLPEDPSFVGLVYNKDLEVRWFVDHGERAYKISWWGPPSGYARSSERVRVRVECLQPTFAGACSPSETADDRDGSIIVRVRDETRADAVRWEAIWIPKVTPEYSPWCRGHQFRVFGHELLESAPFLPEPFGGCMPLEIGDLAE